MSDDTQERAEQIFLEALELPPPQRAPFVDRQCGGDTNLQSPGRLVSGGRRRPPMAPTFSNRISWRVRRSPHISAGIRRSPSVRRTGSEPEPRENARFRILSRYDQGGLGEVLIAHDRQLDREVAIKQIRPKWLGHHEARDRFIQEAEVTGRLEHPGIVPVYAMGTWDDGRPFYAMRFIQGTTLKTGDRAISRVVPTVDPQTKRLELRGLLNRFVDVCNTIEYAHSRQILHRDIKPSNIMVGPYGETLVVDWGLGQVAGRSLSANR